MNQADNMIDLFDEQMQQIIDPDANNIDQGPMARLQAQMAVNANEMNMMLDLENHPEPESDPELNSDYDEEQNNDYGFDQLMVGEENFALAQPPQSNAVQPD